MACTDDLQWANPYGDRCDDYLVKAYCLNGAFLPGMEWTGGGTFDFPEQHCCACGRGRAPAAAGGGGPSGDAQTAHADACKDSPRWVNPYGATCDDYRLQGYCADGGFVSGQEWTGGEGFGDPAGSCCVCGKGTPGRAAGKSQSHAAPQTMPTPASESRQKAQGAAAQGRPGSCEDTPDWTNQFGASCADYGTEGYCEKGGFMPGREWTGGPDFGMPEENCCLCGRKVSPPPLPPSPSPPPLLCDDNCPFIFNGVCQDGGPGAMGASCEYGADCGDCGPRYFRPPPPPLVLQPPPPLCPSPPPLRRSRPHPPPPPSPPSPPLPSPSPYPPPPSRSPPPPSPSPFPPPQQRSSGGDSRSAPPRAGTGGQSSQGSQFSRFGVDPTFVDERAPPVQRPGAVKPQGTASWHAAIAQEPSGAREGAASGIQQVATGSVQLLAALIAGGVSFTAELSEAVAQTAVLEPEHAQLVGVALGLAVGVACLCCVRACCRRLSAACDPDDSAAHSARAAVRGAELRLRHGRRAPRAVPLEDLDYYSPSE